MLLGPNPGSIPELIPGRVCVHTEGTPAIFWQFSGTNVQCERGLMVNSQAVFAMLFDVNKPQHCFAQRLKLQNDSLRPAKPCVRWEESLPVLCFLCIFVVCVCVLCHFMSKRIREKWRPLFNWLLIMDLKRIINYNCCCGWSSCKEREKKLSLYDNASI